jgi:hypothetical protein
VGTAAVGRCLLGVFVSPALLLLVACGSPSGGTVASPIDSSTPVPSSSPSAVAAVQDAAVKALASYDSFRATVVAASTTADYNNADLAKFVADPLLGQVRHSLYVDSANGLVRTGRPRWSPSATAVNVTTHPYTVQITDCFDNGDWTPVHKATGKSAAASGQASRYVVNATVKQYDDGRWLVQAATADRSRSC